MSYVDPSQQWYSQGPPGQVPPPGMYAPPAQPRKRRKLLHFIAYPAVLVVGLAVGAGAGSGSGTTQVKDASDTTSAGSSAVAGAPAKAEAKVAPVKKAAALPDGVYHFGATVKFEDGSTLTAGQPTKFVPGEYAAGGEKFKHHVKFKITFVNHSGKVFDPSLTQGTVSSGDTEGASVYEDGLDAPDNKLLPGKKVTWWMGYGVKKAGQDTLTVRMGFLDYPDVIFTNES